jgi:CRISPR-associated protein Cmr3
MTEFHFLQPLDVLYLRGNRLFADASTPGEALMPPWPSMAAGALRSQILATNGVNVGQFANGVKLLPELAQSLGTPAEPGTGSVPLCGPPSARWLPGRPPTRAG